MPQSVFSWCFLSVSKYFLALFDIWAEPDFWTENRIFNKNLKKPQNMFSWCFLDVSRYFSIFRNMCCEPHFSAENRIFKNFSKSLKTCLGGVFWMLHGIFSIVRHLSWEPDFWAKSRVFTNFVSINCRALLIDKLVMNPGLSHVRITTGYIRYRAENHLIPTHHMTHSYVGVHPASGGWRPLYAGRWAYTSNFVKHILFFKWKLIPRSGHNISHYKTAKFIIHV